jgi:hypothetical protein
LNRLQVEASERKEAVYQIAKAGKGTSIDKLPEDLKNGTQAFGVATATGTRVAETFQGTENVTTDEEKQRYKKTHKNYSVGEQVSRNYDWNLDPNSQVFGKPIPEKNGGVGDAMTWKNNEPSKNQRKP